MSARLAILALGLTLGAAAQADGIYTYTQPDGTIVYTNVPPSGVGAMRVRKVKGSFTAAPRASDPATARASQAQTFDAFVQGAARRYRIPVALVQAIMHAESNFNTHAVSARGASGLMQLMPQTAEEMYVKDLFSAQENIEGGVRYLRVLANTYNGDMVKMVAAYNAGPDALRKFGGQVPPFPETQDYVRKVVALYYQYKQAGSQVARTP